MHSTVDPAQNSLTREEVQRYSRQIMLPQLGMAGQQRLRAARVVVMGAGGLGSPALLYLAAAGVGAIGIVDDDVVDASNLQRQVIHGTSDVGLAKTTSAARRLRDVNPNVEVIEHTVRLTSENALETFRDYDVVLDGTDNFPTRYLVSDAAEILRMPCVWGSIFQFSGQVATFHAGSGPTYRDVFPNPPAPGTVPSCAQGGVVGVLPGMIGMAMANEAIKVITGMGRGLLGRLLVFDALDFSWRELTINPDATREPVRELIDYDQWCGLTGQPEAPSNDYRGLEPIELQELLRDRAAGRTDFDLVDVRESGEFELVHIDGARLIPLGEFGPERVERDRPVILCCRTDARARQAYEVLARAGHPDIRYVRGGVLGWVKDVEPHKPTY